MTEYSETLSPSWWLIAALGLLFPASVLIFLPLSLPVGIATGLALWWGAVGVLWLFAPRIRVDDHGLRAGRARIDHAWIGRVDVFSGDEARVQKGTGLDARAWLVIVPWVTRVVRVSITDQDDPAPYWLISSRRPEQLREAVLSFSGSTPDRPGRA